MKASRILKIKIFLQTVQGETDEEKLLAFLVFVLEAAPMVSCHYAVIKLSQLSSPRP